MRIVGDNGTVLPHDGKAAGNLEVKGPIAMEHYFKVGPPFQWRSACYSVAPGLGSRWF